MDIIRQAAKRQRSISDMLIRDLTPIGPEWESENRLDIIKARQQTAAARALLLELQMVQEEPDRPDSDFVNYDVELMRDADERGDDDVESREEIS
jgi:hypothetical protein